MQSLSENTEHTYARYAVLEGVSDRIDAVTPRAAAGIRKSPMLAMLITDSPVKITVAITSNTRAGADGRTPSAVAPRAMPRSGIPNAAS